VIHRAHCRCRGDHPTQKDRIGAAVADREQHIGIACWVRDRIAAVQQRDREAADLAGLACRQIEVGDLAADLVEDADDTARGGSDLSGWCVMCLGQV
jgi:hypothetical protein